MNNQILPIVLDIETSGLNMLKSGIWQIGAIDLNTMEEFFDECRIDEEDEIAKEALVIIGKTEEELRDKNKETQKKLIEKFLRWIDKRKMINFVCQGPQFDMGFLIAKINKYNLKETFHYRAFDLHTIAQMRYYEKNKKFKIKDNKSDMSLSEILNFCGLPDERRLLEKGDIVKEGKPHNALEDAKLTAECFSRIIFGKNLLPKFTKFNIPEELKND